MTALLRSSAVFVLVGAAAVAQAPKSGGGIVVDAVAAIVNGQAITVSQVDEAAWFGRLAARLGAQAPDPPTPLSEAEHRQALGHLIDQQLLEQARQGAGAPAAAAAQTQQQLDAMVAKAGGPARWAQLVAQYHLSAAAIERIMARQLTLLAFVDARFGPQVAIRTTAIRQYYQDVFVPAAKRRGIRPASLAQASAAIRAILEQQQLMQLEDGWIEALHASAQVHILRP